MRAGFSVSLGYTLYLIVFLFSLSLHVGAQEAPFSITTTNRGMITFSWANVIGYPVFDQLNDNGTWALNVAKGSAPSAPSGEKSIVRNTGTYTFRMRRCVVHNVGATCIPVAATKTVTVTVPPITLSASFEPSVISAGQTSQLRWSSTNADRCFSHAGTSGLKGLDINGTSGSRPYVAPDNVTTTQKEWVLIVCANLVGSASVTAEVTISRHNFSSSISSSSSTSSSLSGNHDIDEGVVTSIPPDNPEPTHPVGSVNGDFRVDESGAASYTIPIAAPEGVAGVKPTIAIAYNSQSGNGLVGFGANIIGLSEISRCRQTLIQDGAAKPLTWTSEDRFCLNSQRLMLVSGTYGAPGSTYKTEIDSQIIVSAVGGSVGHPLYFRATAKDGSTSTFGEAANARWTGAGTLTWAISQFEDNVGNRIDYVYEGGREKRIKTITYAHPAIKSSSSPAAKIEFTYADREDGNSNYQIGGYLYSSTKYLQAIRTFEKTRLYRKYNFNYNETNYSSEDVLSRLTSVEECISEMACYPKTTFEWGFPKYGFNSGQWLSKLPSASSIHQRHFFDFNGDGRQDLIWARKSGNTYHIEYATIHRYGSGMTRQLFSNHADKISYSTNQGTRIKIIDFNADGRQDLLLGKQGEDYRVHLSIPMADGSWRISAESIALSGIGYDTQFADFNADGLVDAYKIENSQVKIYPMVRRSSAPETSNQYYQFATTPIILPIDTKNSPGSGTAWGARRLGDFNGDGRMDFVAQTLTHVPICSGPSCGAPYPDQVWELAVYINTGSAFVKDTNLSTLQFRRPAGFNGCGSCYPPPSWYSLEVSDFNMDGLADVAVYDQEIEWYSYVNNGKHMRTLGRLTNYSASPYTSSNINFIDYDRDGDLDVIWHDRKNHRLMLRRWNGATANFDADTLLSSNRSGSSSFSFGDMNGDGFSDLIESKVDSSGGLDIGIYIGSGDAKNLNRIYKITEGSGKKTEIQYGSLANSRHYTTISGVNTVSREDPFFCQDWDLPSPCVNPMIYTLNQDSFYSQINRPFGSNVAVINATPAFEFVAPVYAVTQVGSSAPTTLSPNNLRKINYHYHHARIQAGGRGYLGFEKISTVDQETGVKTETSYHQDWPFTGSPKRTVVTTKEGNKLSEAQNTWAAEQDVTNQRISRVFLDKTTEVSYELRNGGALQGSSLQTIVTDNDYDEYGNVVRTEVTTSGAANTATQITVNQYYPDEWQRRMGRLDSTVTTTQRNTDPAISRTVKFEYYGQNERASGMLKREIIEPGANQQIVEYRYDLVGNKAVTEKTAEVAPGLSQTRKTEVRYDSSRRFPETTHDGLNNITSKVLARDSVYGSPIRLQDVNGVVTEIQLNRDGTERLRKESTGAWIHTEKMYCGSGIACPAGARIGVVTRVSGGGKSTEYVDLLGRVIRTSKVMFDGRESHVDIEYDSRGRIARQSEPYFSGETVFWTLFEYDLLDRNTRITAPDGSVTLTSYIGYKTQVTVDAMGKALTKTEERNSLGNLVKVTDHLGGTVTYGYDPLGNLTRATTSAGGKTVSVRMCYDKLGRKIGMHDPDKGGFLGSSAAHCSDIESALNNAPSSRLAGWWYYKYNDFGELIEQVDTKRQVSSMEYDALGRMVKRTNKRADGSVETHTRWYYDKYLDDPVAAPNTRLKLTAVVNSYNRIDEHCSGANYCQTYTYDDAARITDTVTYLPNASNGYINTVRYDTIGRAFKQYDVMHGLVQTSGTRTKFNAYGYPELVNDLTTGDVLQKTLKTNARGQIIEELRNNGAAGKTIYTYDDATGRLLNQNTGLAGLLFGIQDVSYRWDALGNLLSRHNQSGNLGANGSTARKNLRESFCYDGLNRLIKSHRDTLTGSCSLSAANQDQEYDGLGNITRKVGVGNYSYTGKGPHAVTATTLGGSYSYDNNGNQTAGAGRSISYNTQDRPTRIVSSAATTDFVYGPDQARFERRDTKAGSVTITHYLGNVERIQVQGSNVIEWKRYIAGAIYTVRTTTAHAVQATEKSYLFNDHLGSLDVVTNAHGKITHSASFDAWGARRSGENWGAAFAPGSISLTGFVQPLTRRGYTGHEMLDDHGLIHMNGRIYDPKLARFLQADPFIQAVTDTQSFNRYSYVMNNPLNTTDPSGFIWSKLWKELKPFVGAIVTIVVSVVCTVCGPMVAGAIGGAVGAAVNGGNIIMGAAFGAFSGAVGGLEGISGFIARGMLGGMQTAIAGGKFGHGFAAAGIGGLGGRTSSTAGFVRSSILGGTASEITGGKFKNGAATAAFMWALRAGANKISEYGRGEPDNVDPHSLKGTNLNVKVTTSEADENGTVTKTLSVSGTYKDEIGGVGEGFEKIIESSWSGEYFDESSNTRYVLSTDISPLGNDLNSLMKGADFTIKYGSCSLNYACANASSFIIDGGPKTLFQVMNDPVAVMHEFGHVLGFNHYPNSSGNVMSYAGSNVSLDNVRLLERRYGN